MALSTLFTAQAQVGGLNQAVQDSLIQAVLLFPMGGTITAIELQARCQRRVNVYLDGAFAFAVSAEVATQAGLKRGMILSDERIAEFVAADIWQKHYDAVLNYLSYRPRSVAEIRRYLYKRQVPEDLSRQLIARLQASGLVDDQAFAQFWVENRSTFSPRSGRALRAELRSKGVEDSTIASALPEDDAEAAYRAACKKVRALAGADHDTFRRKLIPFLQRRGFAYETARSAAERVWQEHSNAQSLDIGNETGYSD